MKQEKRTNNDSKSIDENKIFTMSLKNAEDKLNLLVKNAEFYKNSKHGNRGTMITHFVASSQAFILKKMSHMGISRLLKIKISKYDTISN